MTATAFLAIRPTLSKDLYDDVYRRIYYVSEDIRDFTIHMDDSGIVGIDLTLTLHANEREILTQLASVIDTEVRGLKDVETKRVWDYDDPSVGKSRQVLDALLESGHIYIHGEGQVSLKEPYCDLLGLLDELFEGLSRQVFKAEAYTFPTLLRTDVLRTAGYFDSFPNLLMFVTRLRTAVENFSRFKAELFKLDEFERTSTSLLQFLSDTDYALPPTMCYYVYDMYSGKDQIDNVVITAKGKSFRYESKYQKPLQRLWDFTIRETVFMGDVDFVRQGVQNYRIATTWLMELLEIRGYCETASDPFFLTDNAPNRVNTQKMLGSKFELRLRLNPEETIAAASFNLHSQYIARRFRLYKDKSCDEYIYTGCIGVGVERLLFTFLCQHGLDSRCWPAPIRELLSQKSRVQELIKAVAAARERINN
jgi:hypothetical protein